MLSSGVTLPSRASSTRDIVGDELTVREDLKVAVRVRREQIEELGMQKRLAAENAEVGIPVRLRIADDPVELVERQLLRGRGHIHPASLATQLTARDDRDEQERRKVLAAPPPPFVELDRADALDAEVVDELRHHLRIGFGQHAPGRANSMLRPSTHRVDSHGLRSPPGAPAARAASALARISSGDGSAASTSAGHVEIPLERNQAGLALLERALVVAFLREARLRLHAAIAKHRIHVAAEQRRDVHLHRFPPDVVGLTSSPLIGPCRYFGNMIATSGQTREQAGHSVLQLLWFCT